MSVQGSQMSGNPEMRGGYPEMRARPDVQGNWQNTQFMQPTNGRPSDGDQNLRRMNTTQIMANLEHIDPIGCLAAIAGCSLVISIQGGVECAVQNKWEDEYAYAMAAGIISLLFSLVCLSINLCSSEAFKKMIPAFGATLTLWWICGTWVSTFIRPFEFTGNGYFAAWGAFGLSAALMLSSFNRLRACMGRTLAKVTAGDIESKLSMAILAASLILLVATIVEATQRENISNVADADVVDAWGKTTNAEAWGICCGFGSFFLLLAHTLIRMCCANQEDDGSGNERCALPPWVLGLFLSVWWMFGVAFLTFDGPFKSGGNGYFSCWIAFVLSMWLTYEGYDGYDFYKAKEEANDGVQMPVPETL